MSFSRSGGKTALEGATDRSGMRCSFPFTNPIRVGATAPHVRSSFFTCQLAAVTNNMFPSTVGGEARKPSNASSQHLTPSRKSSRNKLSKDNLKERRSNSASSRDAEGRPRRKRSNLQLPGSSARTDADLPSAATGMSGETVQGSSNSIKLGSKSSKRSLTGKRRASNASIKRKMSEKQQHAASPDNQSPRTLTNPPKQKKGFLTFLCCGSKAAEGDDESFANKPVKTQPERTEIQKQQNSMADSSTANSAEPLNEKAPETAQQGPSITTGDASTGEAQGQVSSLGRAPSNVNKPQPPLPSQADQLDTSGAAAGGPVIAVEEPTPISLPDEQIIHDRTPRQEAIDTDIEMTDAGATVPIAANEVQVDVADDLPTSTAEPLHKGASLVKVDLPPPPPLAERQAQVSPARSPEPLVGQAEPQKWLLGPPRPEHKGRKCLILDLDETLVHSSFKVRFCSDLNTDILTLHQILHQADFTIPVEIEGQYHNVYVIKRPGVDQFMKRVGELYEVVVFTASVSKVYIL